MIDKKVQQVAARILKETSPNNYLDLRKKWSILNISVDRNLFYDLYGIPPCPINKQYPTSAYDMMLNQLLEVNGYNHVKFTHEISRLHLHFSWKEHLCLIKILKK